MKNHTINRRDLMKTAATVVGAGALGVFSGRKVLAASTDKLQATAAGSTAKGATIKVAGYDYDRVRAIMDGQAGMEGAEVNFHVENIYGLAADNRQLGVHEFGSILVASGLRATALTVNTVYCR
jgi:hypothetical protein